MPYSKSNVRALPAYVQALAAHDRAQWIEVWNASYAAAKADGKADADAEAIAFRNANGVLKRRGVALSADAGGPMHEVAQFVSGLFAPAYKTEAGVKFPKAAYAYTPSDEPSTWKIRLWETPEAHETPRQVGMAIAALGPGGFRGNRVEIPADALPAVKARVRAAWKRVNADKKPAEMPEAIKLAAFADWADEPDGEAAEYVLRYGKLFEAGDYPDKALSITPEELAAAVAAFEPVPLDIQHTTTVLDGKVGHWVAAEVGEDGRTLFGTVAVPKWLDAALTDAERQMSTTWDIATKTLQGLAWVVEPRVPGAALEEAYAAFAARRHTYSGQRAIQQIHDVAAENGAVCTSAGAARMHARHEADALQQMHDTAVAHGALCATIREANSPDLPFNAREPNIRRANSPAGFAAGATPQEATTMSDVNESRFAQFMAWLGGKEAPAADAPPADPPPAAPPAPAAGPDPEVARMAAENRKLRQQLLEREAAAFADRYIEAGKAFPAEKAQICAQYVQAAQDDAQLSAAATFDGQTQSRVGLLTAAFEARPAHKLTQEAFAAGVEQYVLANQDQTQRPSDHPSPERLAKLREYARVNGSN